MKLRNILFVTLTLTLISTSAFAWGGGCGWGKGGFARGHHFNGAMGGYGQGYGMRGPRGGGSVAPYTLPDGTQIPKEIIAKMEEMRTVNADLRAAMYGGAANKNQAQALFKKHMALRNDISSWFFQQQLKYSGTN